MISSILLSLLVGLAGVSTIVGTVAIYLSIKLYIALEAMKQSTHKIQYIDPFAAIDPDFKAQAKENELLLNKDYKKFNNELISEGSEFSDFEGDFAPLKDSV